ncbi:maleate cis-trans isomerase [Gordonia sp. CPCC 205515]|uniref:maleate cis-trans isomerase family protein n=1 Tax=Gordonia sp. CPCC 205515 TaxID=3140791 RepID=UPI003AF342DD
MTTEQPAIVMLYPGHAAEDDFPAAERALDGRVRLPVEITAIESDAHTVEAMLAVGSADRLLDAARRASRHAPDALMWACTSGSFLYGWDGARAQADRLAADVGVPVSSTSLAFVDACAALGVTSVAVAASYPVGVADGFTAFLREAGISVTTLHTFDIESATLAGDVDEISLQQMIQAVHGSAAQAILLPDTALHTIGHIDRLERGLDRPLLTANQVTVWQGLRIAGVEPRSATLGCLFRSGFDGRRGSDHAARANRS